MFIYAILGGVIPSLIWLWFWLREDREHPEPRFLILLSFLGGTVAVIVAIFAEKYIGDVVSNEELRYTLWAAVEEIAKFAAVGAIALTTRYNDEPIDAMIYCIACALGFAALENALFVFNPLSGGDLVKSVVTGDMRFMGATLVHVVSSAVVGFTLGFVFYEGAFSRFTAIVVGLLAAIAIHAGFNLSIVDSNSLDTLRVFAWVWGAVVILIVLFEEIKAVRPRQIR